MISELGDFLDYLDFFLDFLDFLLLLWLLLKITKVTTGHQKRPKMGQNNTISSFYAQRAKKSLGQSHPQELEVGPRSGPYLLVVRKGKVGGLLQVWRARGAVTWSSRSSSSSSTSTSQWWRAWTNPAASTCGVWILECGSWSVKFAVWSVECGRRSGKFAVWSENMSAV